MKTVAIGEILNKHQLKEVARIVDSSKDSMELNRNLKDYFGTFREELEAKGMLPEYLAYAVEFALIRGAEAIRQSINN